MTYAMHGPKQTFDQKKKILLIHFPYEKLCARVRVRPSGARG